VSFLTSDAEVFDRLSEPRESPGISSNRVAAAKKLAARLPSFLLTICETCSPASSNG